MAKGGRLKIATRNIRLHEGRAAVNAEVAPGDYIVIEVSDTGTGIDPVSLDHIFEPFFTTKEIGKGTGLGLSIVFGFIQQSGGYVTVDSKLGAGTTFRLCLPRTVESAPAFEARTEEPAPRGAETIVVVEDNPALRRILMKQLAELGYQDQAFAETSSLVSAPSATTDICSSLLSRIMASTMTCLERFWSTGETKLLSILNSLIGKAARRLRLEYPVPKSSTESPTPIARSSRRVPIIAGELSASRLSVNSSISHEGSAAVCQESFARVEPYR